MHVTFQNLHLRGSTRAGVVQTSVPNRGLRATGVERSMTRRWDEKRQGRGRKRNAGLIPLSRINAERSGAPRACRLGENTQHKGVDVFSRDSLEVKREKTTATAKVEPLLRSHPETLFPRGSLRQSLSLEVTLFLGFILHHPPPTRPPSLSPFLFPYFCRLHLLRELRGTFVSLLPVSPSRPDVASVP